MNLIDRDFFYKKIRQSFGSLSQSQVDGINFLLGKLEADSEITNIDHAAYMLATVKHETADTYQPIEEYGHGGHRPYAQPDNDTGKCYYGRGYVQLTWKHNYAIFAGLLKIDLVNNPDLAMVPDEAYFIMSEGMRRGLFAGKSLNSYTDPLGKLDFINARRIINGLDKAQLIAGYAKVFKGALGNV